MLQKIINNKFFIFILCILIAGITTCHVGPSSDWDLVSYHYYNAYAVLHNRIGIDIMPAGIQSYLNPLLDIINYLIITTFHNHTKIVMFLLGIPLGFLYFAVYLISDLLFSKVSEDNVVNFLLKIFAVYVGVTECLITAEIAKSYNDIPVSAMVLFALYLCMKFFQNQKGAYLIFTGLLLGCACGCKLTAAPFALVLVLLFPVFNTAESKPLKQNLAELLRIILWAVIGFLIIDGYWMYFLYQHFQNPFFPLFNGIFQSDLFTHVNYRDLHFIDMSSKKILFFPLYWTSNVDSFVFETPFFDLRHKVAYFACILAPWLFFYKYNIKKTNTEVDDRCCFIFAFTISGYLLWVTTASVLRYLIPVLALSGVFITIFIANFKFLSRKTLICLIVILLYCLQWSYNSPNLGRSKFNKLVTPPELNIEDDSVVLIMGKPLGYFAARPYKNVRFISLANIQDGDGPDFKPTQQYYDKIDEAIKGKTVYILTNYKMSRLADFKNDAFLKKYIKDNLVCEYYTYKVSTFYYNLNTTHVCTYYNYYK